MRVIAGRSNYRGPPPPQEGLMPETSADGDRHDGVHSVWLLHT